MRTTRRGFWILSAIRRIGFWIADVAVSTVRSSLCPSSLAVAGAIICLASAAWGEAAATPVHPQQPVSRADLRQGDALMKAERFEEALPIWQALAGQEPTNSEVLLRLGIAQSMLRRYDEAQKYLEAALKASPGDARIPHNLGLLFLRRGRDSDAETYLKRALAIQGWHPEANYHLGVIAESRGEKEKALELYVRELDGNPSCGKAWERAFVLRQGQVPKSPPVSGPKAVAFLAACLIVSAGLVVLKKKIARVP
ncbi:MAG: tetratricopeptide repeat protein [Planctomycetes bacterium]|nr:tetratricopeptide repeat protein [Planctomycetota bacterium]